MMVVGGFGTAGSRGSVVSIPWLSTHDGGQKQKTPRVLLQQLRGGGALASSPAGEN